MTGQEPKVAFVSAWLIVSSIALLIMLSPYVLSDGALLSASRAFQFQHRDQKQCALCGMTRAFIAISRGDLDEAFVLNRSSVALHRILLTNELLFTIFLVGRIKKLCSRTVGWPSSNLTRQQKRRQRHAIA